jgi:hypothetical protein
MIFINTPFLSNTLRVSITIPGRPTARPYSGMPAGWASKASWPSVAIGRIDQGARPTGSR